MSINWEVYCDLESKELLIKDLTISSDEIISLMDFILANKIAVLKLNKCRFGDATDDQLAKNNAFAIFCYALAKNKTLTFLDLSETRIDIINQTAFASALLKNTQLTELNLDGCGISSMGAGLLLAVITEKKNICKMDLARNRCVPQYISDIESVLERNIKEHEAARRQRDFEIAMQLRLLAQASRDQSHGQTTLSNLHHELLHKIVFFAADGDENFGEMLKYYSRPSKESSLISEETTTARDKLAAIQKKIEEHQFEFGLFGSFAKIIINNGNTPTTLKVSTGVKVVYDIIQKANKNEIPASVALRDINEAIIKRKETMHTPFNLRQGSTEILYQEILKLSQQSKLRLVTSSDRIQSDLIKLEEHAKDSKRRFCL